MHRAPRIVVALALGVLTACGGQGASVSPSPATASPAASRSAASPSDAAGGSPGPSAPIRSSPPSPPASTAGPPTGGQLVTCGFGGFPAADLEAVGEDQDDDDPAAAALRDYIAGARPVADWIPERGYFEVLRTPDLVLWINRNADGPVQGIARGDTDGWRGDVAGCQAPMAVTQGTVPAAWVLAEDADPAATQLAVLATARECAGGEPTGDRLRPPQVVETEDSVTITFTADPLPPGSYDCLGHPPTPAIVRLAAPLGDRTLLDGGTIPPRPAGVGEEALHR